MIALTKRSLVLRSSQKIEELTRTAQKKTLVLIFTDSKRVKAIQLPTMKWRGLFSHAAYAATIDWFPFIKFNNSSPKFSKSIATILYQSVASNDRVVGGTRPGSYMLVYVAHYFPWAHCMLSNEENTSIGSTISECTTLLLAIIDSLQNVHPVWNTAP